MKHLHLTSLAAIGAVAAIDRSVGGDLMKFSESAKDAVPAMADLSAAIRSIPAKQKRGRFAHLSGGMVMHRNMLKHLMALSARRRAGRFGRVAFTSPAKPNLRSRFHVSDRHTAPV